MRKLTIKRTKSFVACLGKMKVYIEDSTSGELVINDVPCRKLGTLKNGEEKIFEIDDSAAKVFVIADKLSKNYCNDYYELPEGSEDVYLSGKNKYNPAAGNAFRFDNNPSEGALANRKRGKKKGLIIFLAAIAVGLVLGFAISAGIRSNSSPKDKMFLYDNLRIKLTSEFKQVNAEGYDVAFEAKDVAIFVLKEEFTGAEGFENYSLMEYADLLIKANGLSSEVGVKDGQILFTYDAVNEETNNAYRYYTYVYKSTDAFWMIQFAISVDDVGEYEPNISKWASSVCFAVASAD